MTEDKPFLTQFDPSELLFREKVSLENSLSANFYRGRRVLVTGGGGSVGSELCRQLAKLSPGRICIFDIYENNAFELCGELLFEHGDSIDAEVRIGSVRDSERLESLFAEFKPDVVIHAAAHKHVPLMEVDPSEAVKNNVFGTYNALVAAEKCGAEKFVLISSDKAVNPTGVMGATKRICEKLVMSRTGKKTSATAVRFGNVLGSRGSVIPLFLKQIERGGPLTVTDKRMTRYFMTVSEAAELVLEAGAMAKHGELYVLDMGKPVRIWDLAQRMVELSGKDVPIIKTGLRSGEKLYEELLVKAERVTKTENSKIFIEKDEPISALEADALLEKLKYALSKGDDIVRKTVMDSSEG